MRIPRALIVLLTLSPFLLVSRPAAVSAGEPGLPPTAANGAKPEVAYDESKGEKRFFEGPSYDPRSGALYFTAFPKDSAQAQILKLDREGKVSVFLERSAGINGTFLSRKGGLLACQGDKSRVLRIPIKDGAAGEPEVLADSFGGKPLPGKPNDLAEDARGGVYFTVPDFAEKKTSAVYYLTPDRKVVKAISDLQTPNGVYVGKGGKVIYVSDSAAKHIRSYPVDPTNGVVDEKKSKMFFDAPTENRNDPDGMTMDERGNLYFTGRGGVWTVTPEGKPLGLIALPEFASNCTFGGPDGRTLYITCQDRVYRLAMKVRGWETASRHEADGKEPLRFKAVQIDKAFRAEGAAIADVNKDGKLDILAGEVWYEAPSFKMREISEPGKYDPTGYSRNFLSWAEDLNGDGYPDFLVIPFPGDAARWYENPQGKPERWKAREIWHSACNETPAFADLLGNGRRQLLMGWQPAGKENEGSLSYFVPPSFVSPAGGEGKWEEHLIGGPKAPGTFRFSHGLGVGDVNGDGLNDVMITDGWWEQPVDKSKAGPWAFHPAPFGPACADMFAYDLNGDGLNDVISSSAHEYGLWWREQRKAADGKIEWRTHLIDDSFSQSHALHLVDMNGDGVKDLVTGKRYFAHNGHDPGEFEPIVLYWFEVKKGNPPTFTPHLMNLGVGIGTQFVLGDLNGDKLTDVVVANKRGVHVLEQVPNGS